jgi:hypothetical protein
MWMGESSAVLFFWQRLYTHLPKLEVMKEATAPLRTERAAQSQAYKQGSHLRKGFLT